MSKKLNRQIDLQVSGLKVREAVEGEKSRTIEGYAVVFGVRSVNLVPWS
jgi:phage head maturation protease